MPEIINVHSALPLNKQVEQYLRRLISQDEYRQGKMLPTELARSLAAGDHCGLLIATAAEILCEMMETERKRA